MKLILILLVLASCQTMTLDEQYDQAVACTEDCQELWDRYETREKIAKRDQRTVCPRESVFVTDYRTKGYCISQEEARMMLNQYY